MKKASNTVCVLLFCASAAAQLLPGAAATPQPEPQAHLKFVVYLSRHGVRSPTGKSAQYSEFSKAPWPTWDVQPGYLTAHGYRLMQIFGAYDRAHLASERLLTMSGCEDADAITLYADSDERTQETAKALADGLFPTCSVPVQALSEGTEDPLFHPSSAGVPATAEELAVAAIAGRIGNDPDALTQAFHAPLGSLDSILATCGTASGPEHMRTSLFDIPATLSSGKSNHAAELRGPLSTASTLTENLLLEYTEGMPASNVGWGCVDGNRLRSLINLHTAASDYSIRTPRVASMDASNLLQHISLALEQAETGRPIPGAIAKPRDRVLFLVGHDTNLSAVSGMLNLSWIADGRSDDTPPGSALVFELWSNGPAHPDTVRLLFTTQTLEQMRFATPLSLDHPPSSVPVFIPACSGQDFTCIWSDFAKATAKVIDSRFSH